MTHYAELVRPDVDVVTSIGSEHIRSLGTLETTRQEKAEMVRTLPPDGLAVLNGDDPNVRWMAGQTRARVQTFGFGEHNDVRATEVALDWPSGTRFRLQAAGESREVQVLLQGRHQLYPILAAVTVALAEGIPLDAALGPLAALEPSSGRLALVQLPNGAFLLRDEFKSALETIDAALDVLAEVPARRRILVLGEVSEPPGSQGPIYRRLGERAAGIASRLILVGGDKSQESVAVGARRAGLPREAIVLCGSEARKAAEAARADLAPGDVVLIKGRDTQRLARVALALMGRQVRCELRSCHIRTLLCDRCPMLERGSARPF
jgi:UDP-N-acetylmuramyl pentapeptide synthase